MQLLDDKVTGALKEQLFDRDRLTELLSSLAERRAARATAVNSRLVSLQSDVATAEQKLKRLYQSIADSIVELDDLLGEQITILKAQREKAKAALDKATAQGAGAGAVTIDPEKVEAFSRLMTSLPANAETLTPKSLPPRDPGQGGRWQQNDPDRR
jgi:predicted nuclease with TOPRIM domain